jgi:TRAP-type C4-dicarboxylate transport system permease small subunit
LIVLAFAFFVMVIGGMRLVNLTFTLNQISPALGIEMGYVYLVIPSAGVLVIYFAIYFIVEAIQTKPTELAEHKITAVD